jgi:NAD(P)-dependent dehydrogenase (short-subunit alcohol dehydrogenase family)
MSALIRTPFGFNTTAAEVLDGIDLSGKHALVTGAASGIGVETARALAGAGAVVTLAVRDTARGAQVAADIAQATGNEQIEVRALELTDPESIDVFTGDWSGPLHILVNNAGVMALPERTLTAHGHEAQFATNHLGHFRLAVGLHDALAAAASPLLDGVTGRYFEDCNEAHVIPERGELGASGVAAYALDPANAERLWDVSLELMDSLDRAAS